MRDEGHFELAFLQGVHCWTVASGLRTQEPVGFRITYGMGRGQCVLLLLVVV